MIAIVAFFYTTAASAQTTRPSAAGGPVESGHWTVTPWLGMPFGGDLEGTSAGLGIAGGYNWNSRTTVEADLAVVPNVTEGVLVNFDANTWNLTANVLYHFRSRPDQRITPFVLGGLGIGHGGTDLVDDNPLLNVAGAKDSTTALVTNWGGGVKYYLNDRFGIRGDLRYYTGHDLVPDFVRLSVGLGIDLGRRLAP